MEVEAEVIEGRASPGDVTAVLPLSEAIDGPSSKLYPTSKLHLLAQLYQT
jgi:hypothetical protein